MNSRSFIRERRVWRGTIAYDATIRRLGLGVVAVLISCGCRHADTPRDMIVFNARIWTGIGNSLPTDAFIVRDGRFLTFGTENDCRGQLTGEFDEVDAQGRRIIPGIIDSHMHLLAGGLQLDRLDLRDAVDRDDFIRRVADRASTTKGWLEGGRWTTESWPDPAQPDKSWIDAVTTNTPALLHRMDGHAALVNSAALRRAGIDAHGPADPPGGRIERDPATGEPTGILKDAAIDLVSNHIPQPSRRELDAALQRATDHALAHGITCVHTMEDWQAFEVFDRARRRGTLRLRIRQYLSESDWEAFLPRVEAAKRDPMLQIVGFKEYADGSLGSRTAYMAEPYADNAPDHPQWCGLLREAMQNREALIRKCSAVYAKGYAPAIHAIGDQANHEVLDLYSSISATSRQRSDPNSAKRLCPRIEHAQHLLPADVARFANEHVIASMQPYHKADDARYAERAIGAKRCATSYAYRSLVDSGATVCFGSDWPVVSLNPFIGIHVAVTGTTVNGDVFQPSQNLTVAEALAAYTSQDAKHSKREMLAQDHADFVILDRDVLTIPPAEIPQVKVVATYIGGVRQYPR